MYYYMKYQSLSSSIIERQTDLSRTSALQPASTFPFCIYSHNIPRLPFTITMTQNSMQRQHESNKDHLTINRPMNEATDTISPTNSAMELTSISLTSVHTSVPYLVRDSNLKTKKKYKPVAQKVRAVLGEMPEKFRVMRKIIGDPLKDLPKLSPNPPPFIPTGRYNQERKEIIDKMNPRFLLPAKRELLHHFMSLHQDGFTWNDSERGHFRENFFPPI